MIEYSLVGSLFPIFQIVFTYPALLWFLPLLGVAVLIHLINMFRHRRVEWAALEFLLASYRKSRTRILLQQLLLMLLRTLAVAAVIFMFASPKLEGTLADWFGGKPMHHLVLLDDSFSMNERNTAQGDTPIFEDAVAVIKRIADNIARRKSNDRLTVIRLSRAAAVEKGEEPDVAELLLNSEGISVVQDILTTLKPSQSAKEPEELFAAAIALIRQSNTRLKPVAYFLSDFRRRNWENPVPVLKQLEEIRQLGGMIRMVRVADNERPNLSIDSLELVDGIHAANIDLLLDAKITNHGQEDAENVHLTLSVDGQSQSSLTVPKIKAGEQISPPIRFPVRLEGSEPRRIEVHLQPDAVPDDNRRFLVVNVPEAIEVLLITPEKQTASATQSATQYVRVALSPGGTKSGIRTRIEPPSFLVSKPLIPFSAIFLLDVPSLESAAVKALEEYVSAGGGITFFLGPESNLDFIRNELYKNGTGLFPAEPITEALLEPDFLSKAPDVSVAEHPIFRLFGEGESPLLGSLKIERYVALTEPLVTVTPGAHVLATLRNGAPLVLEKEFGKGRTVTFLTTAAPTWNNWGRGNPSFVVVMLELAAWLSKRQQNTASILVSETLNVHFDPTIFERKARLQTPAQEDGGNGTNLLLEAVQQDEKTVMVTSSRTDRAGFYEVTLKELSGNDVRRVFAVNVNAREGDIMLCDVSELSDIFRKPNQTLESAAGFSTSSDFSGEHPLSDALLYAVIIMLVAETFLAGRILPPMKR